MIDLKARPFFSVFALTLAIQGCGPAERSKARTDDVYVTYYRSGYALANYTGEYVKEFARNRPDIRHVAVLFDQSLRPLYALTPEGHTIAFYKVTPYGNRDLVYAISTGPHETRVYEGPFSPEEGFPRPINARGISGINDAYLNPTAEQKVDWLKQLPMLPTVQIGGEIPRPAMSQRSR